MAKASAAQASMAAAPASSAAGGGRGEAGHSLNSASQFLGSLTPAELHELHQYEKLVRFRDEIAAGLHPHIKPPHLLGKSTSSLQTSPDGFSSPAATSPRAAPGHILPSPKDKSRKKKNTDAPGLGLVASNSLSFRANSKRPAVNTHLNTQHVPSGSGPDHPLPWEDLALTEMKRLRLKLERDLRDQHDQAEARARDQKDEKRLRRPATEQPTEADASTAMAAALRMVGMGGDKAPTDETALAAPTSADKTAANSSPSASAVDSFDDKTFYSSSQPSMLESPAVSSPSDEPVPDEPMRDDSPYEPTLELQPVAPLAPVAPIAATNHSASLAIPTIPAIPAIPAPSAQPVPPVPTVDSQQIGRAHGLGGAADKNNAQPQHHRIDGQIIEAVDARLASPIVRAHNLSPIAPQPAHVCPLAVARQAPAVMQHVASALHQDSARATPAQVVALRKQQAPAASTPNTLSPTEGFSQQQASHKSTKSKGKKKQHQNKVKTRQRPVAEMAATRSPFIKHEPRSPSPLSASAYPRPSKRQRRWHPARPQQPFHRPDDAEVIELDEEMHHHHQPLAVEHGTQHGFRPSQGYRLEERVVDYEVPDEVSRPVGHHGGDSVLIADQRYERYQPDEAYRPAPVSIRQVVRPASPYSAHYFPGEVRTVRSVSHVEPPYGQAPPPATYYREYPRAPSRMSMVQPGGRAMNRDRSRSPVMYEPRPAAMARPPQRMVMEVDEFGNPLNPPPRSATVIGREEVTEDGRVIFRRLGSPIGYAPVPLPPRRVMTQPEYGSVPPEYRSYRDREQAVAHPMPPPNSATRITREYVSGRSPYDAAGYYEQPRQAHEYAMPPRAASVRPGARHAGAGSGEEHAPRYDMPLDYEQRTYAAGVTDEAQLPPRQQPPIYRSASVMPYEGARDYAPTTRLGSVVSHHDSALPPAPMREYAPAPGAPRPREGGPGWVGFAPGRAYSVAPADGMNVVRGEYNVRHDRFYAEPPPPLPLQQHPQQQQQQQQRPAGRGEEAMYLDRPPVGGYYR